MRGARGSSSTIGDVGHVRVCVRQLELWDFQGWRNSIAFGSAPGREADSQPISQASRQADRNTQFGFFRWQTRLQALGRADAARSSNGPTVMHSTAEV